MTIEITKRPNDQPTKCLFQKINDNGEWETYLTVGEYPLSELKKVLIGLCNFFNDEENSTDEI